MGNKFIHIHDNNREHDTLYNPFNYSIACNTIYFDLLLVV